MLGHTVGERDVIILAPATERMEKEDGIAVALSNELLAIVPATRSVVKDVSIMFLHKK